MPIVEIDSLHHRYGDRTALEEIDLRIDPGEVFGFLGPNGSGKTTLFRILSTLVRPTSGQARIDGHDVVSGREAVRRHIGVVFQSPSLDKQLTAEENLRHAGHLYGLRGEDLSRRIDALLERVGLLDRKRERVERFSGGMRRRVELAKGLLHRPAVLLLDEPSTGLDPRARIDLWNLLGEVRQRDAVTILVTTHLMDEAERCTRLAILDRGRVVAEGSPADLKAGLAGDVVTLHTTQPSALREALQQRFELDQIMVMGDELRIRRPRGHELIAGAMEAWPDLIDSASVGQATLEDVFIQMTGHGFSADGQATESTMHPGR